MAVKSELPLIRFTTDLNGGLQYLYHRKAALDALIRSIERYNRSLRPDPPPRARVKEARN